MDYVPHEVRVGCMLPPSAWLVEPHSFDRYQSTPTLPRAVDVVVVGAGIAGCAAALHCGRLGRSCVLLDSGGVAGGATGRNGGHLWPAGGGLNTARGRYEASAVQRLQQLLRELSDDETCELHFPGSIELAVTAEQAEYLKSGSGEFWDAERVRQAYQSAPGKLFGGMFHADGGMLHPVRSTRMLAEAAVTAGVNLQTHCKATEIRGGGGEPVEVVTERGVVQAAVAVIVCVNAWSSALLPELEGVVVPHVNHVFVTEPIPQKVWAHPFTADDDTWYGMQRPDGRIVIGGAPLPSRTSELRASHAPALDARSSQALFAWACQHFPFLGQDIKLQTEWAGYLTETADLLPLLGRLPSRDRVWVCGGFNGHGMPVGAAMGAECAALALASADVSSEPYLETLAPGRLLSGAKSVPHSNISGEPLQDVPSRLGTCVWDHYVWETLPDKLRSEWECLGWVRESFNGHVPPPASEDMSWSELSEQQKRAASVLGYTQELWDADREHYELPAHVIAYAHLHTSSSSSSAAVRKTGVMAESAAKPCQSLGEKDLQYPPRKPVLGAPPAPALPLLSGGGTLGSTTLPSVCAGGGAGMLKKSGRGGEEQRSIEEEMEALFAELDDDLQNIKGWSHGRCCGGSGGGGGGGGEGERDAPVAARSRGQQALEEALIPSLLCPLPHMEPAIGGVIKDKIAPGAGGGGVQGTVGAQMP
jgi:gamma-glutamylputrescine oxidase